MGPKPRTTKNSQSAESSGPPDEMSPIINPAPIPEEPRSPSITPQNPILSPLQQSPRSPFSTRSHLSKSPELPTDPPPDNRPKHQIDYTRKLQDIGEPIHIHSDYLGTYEEVTVNFDACAPVSSFGPDGDYNAGILKGRHLRALALGKKALDRSPISDSPRSLSRKEERNVFALELSILNELLTMVLKYEDESSIGLAIRKELLVKLNKLLLHKRSMTTEAFRLIGEGPPNIPLWAYDGRIEYWPPNDFEILGAYYRYEVETFLAHLADHFEFGQTRNKPFQEERPQTRSNPDPDNKRKRDDQSPKNNRDHDPEYISYFPRQSQSNRMRSAAPGGKNAPLPSVYYNPTEYNTSRRMRDLFPEDQRNRYKEDPPHFNRGSDVGSSASQHHQYQGQQRPRGRGKPDPSDSDNSSSDSDKPKRPTPSHKTPRGQRPPGPSSDEERDHRRGTDNSQSQRNETRKTNQSTPPEPQFDSKLKIDIIPTWDGNPDTLGRWIIKINELSDRSKLIFQQLGKLVPSRLKGTAETWYYSQSSKTRTRLEVNWATLREGIGAYFMNRAYMDKQKGRANRATFRDSGNARESPSEYFIRKRELIEMVYDYTDGEIINEIMNGAPSYWSTVLTPHLYNDAEEFQIAIKFHEDNLTRMDSRAVRFDPNTTGRDNFFQPKQFTNFRNARTNLVGWSKNSTTPEFPKDDSNISPRGTPEDKGARPCRHCGSGKHWDPECKYSRKAERKARANLSTTNQDETTAQNQYDELYYGLQSEDEYESAQEDFYNPLQEKPNNSKDATESSGLGGEATGLTSKTYRIQKSGRWETNLKGSESLITQKTTGSSNKPALNRRTRRKLARDIEKTVYLSQGQINKEGDILELKKYMARPPGCSFLGAHATETVATLNSRNSTPISVIIDSGSDITLISQQTVDKLLATPKIRTGQRINLIQVTGSVTISGYIIIDLIFETNDGPVKLNVEAYVVKGMSTHSS